MHRIDAHGLPPVETRARPHESHVHHPSPQPNSQTVGSMIDMYMYNLYMDTRGTYPGPGRRSHPWMGREPRALHHHHHYQRLAASGPGEPVDYSAVIREIDSLAFWLSLRLAHAHARCRAVGLTSLVVLCGTVLYCTVLCCACTMVHLELRSGLN